MFGSNDIARLEIELAELKKELVKDEVIERPFKAGVQTSSWSDYYHPLSGRVSHKYLTKEVRDLREKLKAVMELLNIKEEGEHKVGARLVKGNKEVEI